MVCLIVGNCGQIVHSVAHESGALLGETDVRIARAYTSSCDELSITESQNARLFYGVKKLTTVCTALLVPFTVLCATFLAVIAVCFATCLAVRTGPALTLLAQTTPARMIENNAFIVLKFRN